MMHDCKLQMCLSTLETYSQIYRNLTQTGAYHNPGTTPVALSQLETIITNLILHLHTHAKGQIS